MHDTHQQTLGTWFGDSLDGGHIVTAQFVVHGKMERDAYPVLVLLDDRVERTTCELTWGNAVKLGLELLAGSERFSTRGD